MYKFQSFLKVFFVVQIKWGGRLDPYPVGDGIFEGKYIMIYPRPGIKNFDFLYLSL